MIFCIENSSGGFVHGHVRKIFFLLCEHMILKAIRLFLDNDFHNDFRLASFFLMIENLAFVS